MMATDRVNTKRGPATAHAGSASHFRFDGSGKIAGNRARSRMLLSVAIVFAAYSIIVARLVFLGFADPAGPAVHRHADASTSATRPDLVDRNGEILATDIKTASLYAEPRRIVDADEALELLATALPGLDLEETHRKLSSDAGFVWLRRELTPRQQSEIHALGIPGIGFRDETRRFYPQGQMASHIVGHVNIDNIGIAGFEKHVDDQGLADLRAAGFARIKDLDAVQLSLDLRVQHIVHDELTKAMDRYRAIAAGAIVLDADSGEILAMASLPDYDPNDPVDALKPGRMNRMTAGLFEMGSIFKAFTAAAALDSGLVTMEDKFDAREPVRIGGHRIEDFHAKRRWLTVPEVFVHSSNIGAVKMAQTVGLDQHRAFVERLGLLDRIVLEIPEIAVPRGPKRWRPVHSATISFGHGMQTTPLQTAVAGAVLVNGGRLITPTLLPRAAQEADAVARQVISKRTSDHMRYLLRRNIEVGSGSQAEVRGYRVGGKTGTAEKVVDGRYVPGKLFNTFLAAFPIDAPRYVVLAFIDEPQPEPGRKAALAGLNAAPIVGAIVRRGAPVLGVRPVFQDDDGPLFVSY